MSKWSKSLTSWPWGWMRARKSTLAGCLRWSLGRAIHNSLPIAVQKLLMNNFVTLRLLIFRNRMKLETCCSYLASDLEDTEQLINDLLRQLHIVMLPFFRRLMVLPKNSTELSAMRKLTCLRVNSSWITKNELLTDSDLPPMTKSSRYAMTASSTCPRLSLRMNARESGFVWTITLLITTWEKCALHYRRSSLRPCSWRLKSPDHWFGILEFLRRLKI